MSTQPIQHSGIGLLRQFLLDPVSAGKVDNLKGADPIGQVFGFRHHVIVAKNRQSGLVNMLFKGDYDFPVTAEVALPIDAACESRVGESMEENLHLSVTHNGVAGHPVGQRWILGHIDHAHTGP